MAEPKTTATDPGAWEELCRQCGACCFEKWVEGDGTIHPTRIPCRHLDLFTRRCRVYHRRLEVGEGCVKLTPELVEIVQWLPADCAYVRHVRGTGPAPPTTGGRRRQRKRSRRGSPEDSR